jgi:hypothetical protein
MVEPDTRQIEGRDGMNQGRGGITVGDIGTTSVKALAVDGRAPCWRRRVPHAVEAPR